jgi:hypothetical protein
MNQRVRDEKSSWSATLSGERLGISIAPAMRHAASGLDPLLD